MRTSIAPRTQDSGMLVDAMGSRRGREGSTSVDEGRMPACWCCNNALPRARVLGVRVSAGRDTSQNPAEQAETVIGLTATAEAGTDAVNTF